MVGWVGMFCTIIYKCTAIPPRLVQNIPTIPTIPTLNRSFRLPAPPIAHIFLSSLNGEDCGMTLAHGGRREGSGRKPAGGLSPTKVLRTEARALLAEIVGTKRDPLMVAIDIASDPSKPDALRLEAALGASRFLHPMVSSTTAKGVGDRFPAQRSALDTAA